MIDEVKSLTVAEFSEQIGITKQAIYKRINKDLKPYTKRVNGILYISSDASTLFKRSQEQEPKPPPPYAQTNTPTQPDSNDNRMLLEQLKVKDKLIDQLQQTIKDLNTQNHELQLHLVNQSDRFTELLQTQAKLQENFQILLGKKQLLEQSATNSSNTTIEPTDKPTVDSVDPVDSTVETPEQADQIQPEESEPPPKKGFFAKLFGF